MGRSSNLGQSFQISRASTRILVLSVRFMLIKITVRLGCLIAAWLSLLMETKGNVIFKMRNCGRNREVHVFCALH